MARTAAGSCCLAKHTKESWTQQSFNSKLLTFNFKILLSHQTVCQGFWFVCFGFPFKRNWTNQSDPWKHLLLQKTFNLVQGWAGQSIFQRGGAKKHVNPQNCVNCYWNICRVLDFPHSMISPKLPFLNILKKKVTYCSCYETFPLLTQTETIF